jgi:hypothetical protein
MLGEMRAVGQCTLCIGSQNIQIGLSTASGSSSNAFGTATSGGDYAWSIGSKVFASGDNSFVIGQEAVADASYTFNYIFGSGIEDYPLLNNVSNSIMFGIGSDKSTILVGGASGAGTWGNVGIGNITAPASLLHVRDQLRVGYASTANGSVIFNNSTNTNTVTIQSGVTSSNYSLTLPTGLGTTNQVLALTAVSGSVGTLGWANGGGTTDWELAGNSNATSTSKLGTMTTQPLMIYANSAERMRVATDGNVGIGQTAPLAQLHVGDGGSNDIMIEKTGSNGIARLRFFSDAATDEYANIIYDADENLFIDNEAQDQEISIRLNCNGTVYPALRFDGNAGNSTFPFMRAYFGSTSMGINTWMMAEARDSTGEEIARFGVTDVNMDNTLGAGQYVSVENSINNDAQFSGGFVGRSSSTVGPAFYVRSTVLSGGDSGGQPAMRFDARTESGSISTRPLFRWTNDVNTMMQMNANGNLGIGTTTPSGKLHVNGDMYLNYGSIPGGSATTDYFLGFNSGGQVLNLGASSVHFKNNIQDIEFDKEAFLNLRPVNFTWKEYQGGQNDVGLIAQEVQETFPALASWSHKYTYLDNGDFLRDSLGIPVVDTTQMEVGGVRYHKLPVYLLAIVKDQQAEIHELRQSVSALMEQVNNCCVNIEPINRYGQGESDTEPYDSFKLLRNDPNPYSDYTDIKYDHSDCTRCKIIISDLSGRIIKRISTAGPSGTIRIYSSEIGNGTFLYSLVKDGRTVRTERMVSSNR